MRQWIIALLFSASSLATLSGCSSSGNDGLEGAWRGTLTWADERGTQAMFWSVYKNPASIGHSDTVHWVLNLKTPAGCEIDLDYGLLTPEEDGSLTLPLENVTNHRDCFSEVTADALGSNRLQLAIVGDFIEDTESATGTATLRSVDSAGAAVTIFREGTWEATLDQ